MELIVKMPNATGKLDGLNLTFGAKEWHVDKTICGSMNGTYFPDNFSGTIDTKINEFQSVNNDGGSAVNEPVVFRRISCFDPSSTGQYNGPVKPPDFEPPKKGFFRCGK
jgi:hypothetical protein